MSAAALAALPAAPHPEPPSAAAGAGARGTTVRVPLRLVVGPQYADTALSTYVKVKALALRPEGCTARVATLAEYLGTSKSSVERGLRPLINPDPVDGLVEVPTVRRTKSGGTGESAHRVTRPLAPGELWVLIPVRAAETLTPRLLRLYALLTYAIARRIPVTASELGELLRHHTGEHAGEHLGERQTRRLVDELESTGWLTVHRREGEQGRHAYETHRHPLHSVPATAEALEDQAAEQGTGLPVSHDGSGPDLGDGSLASREDLGTGRREKKSGVGGGIRRRRSTGSRPAASSATAASTVPDTFGRGHGALRADTPPPVVGPKLSSEEWATVWGVLAPVAHDLTALSSWEWARTVREILTQLEHGATADRLIDRLTRRYASTTTIRSMGRWLLGVGLVRYGCGRSNCETGVIYGTGRDCELCAVNKQVAAARQQRVRETEESERRLAARRLARSQHQAPGLGDDALPTSTVDGPAPTPVELAPGRVLPAKATYRQRSRVSDGEIRTAIATLGSAYALHVYGALRTLPLLRQADETTEPVAEPSVGPAYAYMPDRVRAQLGAPTVGDLAVVCPKEGCAARPGQPCTTPRGRRRADVHQARLDAAHGSRSAAGGEEI